MAVKNALKIALRLAVAVGAFGVLLGSQDLGQLWKIISGISLWSLAAATGFFMFASLLMAVRWSMLLRSQSIEIGLWAIVRVNFLGLFYNNFLFSSIGGDLLRAWYITHHTKKRVEAAFSVIVDRICGLVVILLMALSVLGFLSYDKVASEPEVAAEQGGSGVVGMLLEKWPILAGFVGIMIVLGVVLIFHPKSRPFVLRFWEKALNAKTRVFSAIKLYLKSPFTLLAAVILTVMSQGITIYALFLMGNSLGIPIALKYYFVVFPIGWLVSSLPVTPGGIGILELGVVALFMVLAGVSQEQGMSIALCQRAIFILGSLPGGFIHVSGWHLPRSKDEFSIDY